jgi:hypothetical protein
MNPEEALESLVGTLLCEGYALHAPDPQRSVTRSTCAGDNLTSADASELGLRLAVPPLESEARGPSTARSRPPRSLAGGPAWSPRVG